jgi:hypothetical protein
VEYNTDERQCSYEGAMGCLFGCASFVFFLLMGLMTLLLVTDLFTEQRRFINEGGFSILIPDYSKYHRIHA